MEQKTKKEIAAKAWEKVSPIAEKEKTTTKDAIENIAFYTTMITIGAYVVMYAYKLGYCNIFNIPSTCVRVSLKDYLPFLFLLCVLSIYILWYIISLKSDKALNRITINGARIAQGYLIISILMKSKGILRSSPSYVSIVIPLVLSLLIEIIIFEIGKLRIKTRLRNAEKTVAEDEEQFVLQDMISNIFLSRYYIRTGVFVLTIAVIIMPYWGKLVAKANNDFQLFQIDDLPYAVIVDYEDSIIAQKVKVDDTSIEINISNYSFFQKEGLEFEYQSFEHVTRTTEFSDETAVDDGMTFLPASSN